VVKQPNPGRKRRISAARIWLVGLDVSYLPVTPPCAFARRLNQIPRSKRHRHLRHRSQTWARYDDFHVRLGPIRHGPHSAMAPSRLILDVDVRSMARAAF
jgi:hypothetical protein